MATTTDTAVALDAVGRLCAVTDLDETTPEAMATAVCKVVQELLDKQASVVSCSVLGQGTRGFAMVMLRDGSAGGFLSGTASSEDHADALVQAVLTALGVGDAVVATVARGWAELDGITAVSVITDDVTPVPDSHEKLVRAMPAPGRLAVTTADAEYRVLRLPAMAVVVQATPGVPALDKIDVWMTKAEALGR